MPVVIKMKGLPFESTAKDIQMFFEGLYLREEDIHLAAYRDGKASGIAFAVFKNDDDARQAMFRNEKYMGKRYIELFLSSTSEMNTMLDEGVPDPKPTKARRSEFQDEQRSTRGREDHPRPRNVSDRRGRPHSRSEDERKGFSVRNRSRSPRGPRERPGFERGREGGRGGGQAGCGGREGGHSGREGGRGGREGGRGGREGGRGGRQDRGRGSFRGRGSGGRGESDFGRDKRQIEITSSSLIMPNLFDLSESSTRISELGNDRASIRESRGSGGRFDRDSLGESFGSDDSRRRKTFREESSFGNRERTRNADPLLDEVCVRLQGLPFVLSAREVISFFKGLNVVQVKFLHHPDGKFAGRKTGEGYVEFRSVHDAMEAQKKNRGKLGHRFIEVHLTTKMDMMKSLEKNDMEIKRAGGQRVEDNDTRYETPVSDLAMKISQDILRQASPSTSRILERGLDLPSLGIPLPGSYGLPTESLEAQTVATLNRLASTANINPDDVTAGCVVGIRNLPSSISAKEIVDFFYGYSVFPDTVRIHYLAPGRSSGDAMITLRNTREAMAAIQELNHRHVGKRSVQLFLV